MAKMVKILQYLQIGFLHITCALCLITIHVEVLNRLKDCPSTLDLDKFMSFVESKLGK